MIYTWIRLLLLTILFCANNALAQTGPTSQTATAVVPSPSEKLSSGALTTSKISGFTITAENLYRDLEKGIVQISGNVQIIYQNQHFSADFVEINLKKKHAYFRGHVSIQTIEYNIGGDEIALDYYSSQALITNGYVQSNNITFKGKLIEQRGPNTFFVADADYTTCTNCPSTWSFEGSQIRAELGGYAFLKNTFLKVSNVPIFWLPYLVLPLKNERQSGFLTPEFGYIRNRGLFFSESFFWAMSRSQDLTFTLKNYELGGLKELIEYRYAISDFSGGQINFAHFNDSVIPKDLVENGLMAEGDTFKRWAVQGYAQQEINDVAHARVKLNQISDLQYPKDFYEEFKTYAEGGLENRLNISARSNHSLAQLDSIYYKHLLESNPLQSNTSAVHILPELKLDFTTTQIAESPFYFKFNAQYDAFYRKRKWDDISVAGDQKYVSNVANDPACDHNNVAGCSPSYDGTFNQGTDFLRTGQRIFYKASFLTQTFTPVDFLNVSPELSYNEAHYFFPEGTDRYNVRQYTQLDINSRSRLYRVYESEDPDLKYKHELIPELSYTYIPFVEQKAHPFFGNIPNGEYAFSSKNNLADTDLNTPYGVQYDYHDRIYDRHLITLTFLNRVIRKRQSDKSYKNILDFRLAQSYDLYQINNPYSQTNQPLSDLSGTLNMYLGEFTLENQFSYYPYLSATNSTTALSYLNDLQQYFKIGYNSNRAEGPRVDDLVLALGFVTKYINVLSGFIVDTSEDRNSDSRLKKFSLITQLKPPGECWGINFYREQQVGLEAEWRVRFDFSFDGKPPKIIPPDELKIK
ncbi:MAG: LPS assembly protein LptD [Pseudobdellovibrio sp.]|nr:LPS assembly protein LptD [Pseudobdellovibrio sp.]